MDVPDSSFKIGYDTPVLSIGSCFATHIAEKLNYHFIDTLSNPNGILFNPISIAENLRNTIAGNAHNKADLVEHDGLFHSWRHHHSYSDVDADMMIDHLNRNTKMANDHLGKSKIILITFGTAFAYKYLKTNSIVANCHKIPNNRFEKIRLSVLQIVEEWEVVIKELFKFNPDADVIMTVSPVRHLKDGFIANQRSKASLILAAETLSNRFPNVHYFPSYEIMMDDLRDYRFYNDDMLHPNSQAIDYIWGRFVTSHMSEDTQSIMQEIAQFQRIKAHRVLLPESESAIIFQKSKEAKWEALVKKYPFLKDKF